MMLKAGEVFERKYRVTRLLGQGGMGAVYEVEHLRVPGRYALKIMLPELTEDPTFQERFFREISIARELVHPNVVTVRDCDVAKDGACYYTMDLSPGVPLTKLAKEPLEWRRALALTRQLLLALSEAHKRGIVHRDVKPDNVLVEGKPPDEHVKVLDFGIARAFRDAPGGHETGELTAHAGIVGTPAYIAPEQALGERVDNRADLYAVGCTLHRILTGNLPFKSETPTGFYGQHIAVPPPPIRGVRPEARFPEALEKLVLRALEKNREKRFQSAEEMIAAIDALLRPSGERAGASAAPGAGPSPQGRLSALPTGGFERAKLLIYPPVTNAIPRKVFLFALDRVPFGRARPRPGVQGENAIVLWLLPARSEREDPENFRATLEISGRHGEIQLQKDGAFIVDQSSRGTKLDGAPLEKGKPARLPERFTLEVAGVLSLEGRTLGREGAQGVVLRRQKNCDHISYAVLSGEAPIGSGEGAAIALPEGAPEEAVLVARGGSGFSIRPGRSTGAKLYRHGKPVPATGEGTPLLFGDELQLGACTARFLPLEEADMREP
jgi:serine/threonine-protein kinase